MGKLKIIHADSNNQFLEKLSGSLSLFDFDIDSIDDTSKLFDALNSFKPDLLILDIFAKPISGIEIVRDILKKREKTSEILPIIITYPDNIEINNAMFLKQNNIFYVPKYLNVLNWLQKIEIALNKD